jgi:glyoxylase-like metal-dependent hydrolase (beta-lactamase superfamily II)
MTCESGDCARCPSLTAVGSASVNQWAGLRPRGRGAPSTTRPPWDRCGAVHLATDRTWIGRLQEGPLAKTRTELDGDPRLVKLSGDAYAFCSYPAAGLLVTDEGCIAIDGPMSPRNIMPWRDFINAQGNLRYQIYCEHHQDHTASACYLEPDVLIASEGTSVEMVTTGQMLDSFSTWAHDPQLEPDGLDDFEVRYPTLTYSDRMSIDLGGKRFVLFHGTGHTVGSTIVHAIDDRIAFIADNGFTPAIQSGDPWNWLRTIATLEALDVDWYVQGHGDPFPREKLPEWREVLLKAFDRAREWRAEGLTPADVVERGGFFRDYVRTEHLGGADMPPNLLRFSSTVLQERGAEVVFEALDRHPSAGAGDPPVFAERR